MRHRKVNFDTFCLINGKMIGVKLTTKLSVCTRPYDENKTGLKNMAWTAKPYLGRKISLGHMTR